MNDLSKYFDSIGEPYAAGFFIHEDASLFRRYCDAHAHFLAVSDLPDYGGGRLYPSGSLSFRSKYAARPEYSYTFALDSRAMKEKCDDKAFERLSSEMVQFERQPTPHSVGGYLYTHSMPNFERIAKEGLDSYRKRLESRPDDDFRAGLLSLLDGIAVFHSRSLEKLKAAGADSNLISALEKVPFSPAGTLYEAVVCRNFIYYLDGCDNPGRLDTELFPYYSGEDITDLFSEFFDNVDVNSGWSSALGPDYNPLTLQILRAGKGKRRPSLELRVTPDMPDDIWQAAADDIKSGSGSPSLYNEPLYQSSLAKIFPTMPEADRIRFNGGGCTETMLAGISRVGSLDAGINTALVFSDVMRSRLSSSPSFDDFYAQVLSGIKDAVDDTLDKVESAYRSRMKLLPNPMRTLLIDDCIEKGLDFNAGGARWNWSVINFAGLINVIDSLLAVRELIFEKKEYKSDELISGLDSDDPALYARLKKCRCFGVDDPDADSLAYDFSRRVFGTISGRTPVLGGRYLPSSIQFVTYTDAGKPVPATPDGRHAGDPLCDSLGAIHGRDVKGPTALLCSVSALDLSTAAGTPVLNLRMRPDHIDAALKPLIEAFFRKGGMQVQISCVSRSDMEDAIKHPEKHENLIVRVGGYSEYFNRLTDELKRTIMERTEY